MVDKLPQASINMQFIGDQVPQNQALGYMKVTYYCVFRGQAFTRVPVPPPVDDPTAVSQPEAIPHICTHKSDHSITSNLN